MAEGLPPCDHTMIAAGLIADGFPAVRFEQAWDSTFRLRRRPSEIEGEATLTSPSRFKNLVTVRNALIYGVARPIQFVRVPIWGGGETRSDDRRNVEPHSPGVILPAGPALIQLAQEAGLGSLAGVGG